jgi:hypothetical protein
MDLHLRSFIAQWLRVVAAALVPVALTTFVCLPLSLGGDPSEPVAARATDHHMT